MKKLLLLLLLFTGIANAQIVNIPDANFKAKLLAASPSNTIASTQTPNSDGQVSIYNKIDTNNDGEIQVSEAITIKYLNVGLSSISSLEGINSFSNLQTFRCYNNQITSLNLIGLSSLRRLDCSYNQFSSLDVSYLTNLQKLSCSGCSDSCSQLSSLNVSGLINLKILECPSNLLTSLDVSGLTNLQALYCDNNQLQTLSLNNLPSLTYLRCFDNQLQSIDVRGLPVNFLSCQDNQLVSLFVKNGGSYWTNLEFDNNPNLAYICADEEDLTLVQNLINQYGYSTTCQANSYCDFNPGGVNYKIQGTTKIDGNNNGCDTNDSVYPNLKFNITNGIITGSLISNASGNYSIPVSGGTHTITPQFENSTYFTANPTSATITFPVTTSPFIQDFCIIPNGVHHDLEVIVIPLRVAVPGFDVTYKIKYKNKGNQNENTTINFNYNDAILDYVSSNVSPTSQATGTLSWNIGTITPFQSGEFIVTLNVNSPMETPAVNGGDVLSYTATANGLVTDETPDDNTFVLSQTVFNSFDPNDKTCLEGTTINPSNIGKYLHYKIRFENTGTFAAQNIVVKDMIDTAKFDIASLQMTDSSHSCITRITNPNRVEFIFENINLPFDDANNDGYVVFKIKTKPTLVVGNTISNSANIYFDYNFPIVTNTATSTFSVLQNDTFEFDNYFIIYPNPVDEVLNLNTKQATEIYSLTIYNLLGQQVQTTTNPTNTVDVSSLKTGNYIIKVVTDKGVSSSKFVKE